MKYILIFFICLSSTLMFSQTVEKDSTQLAKTGTATTEKDKQHRTIFTGSKGGQFVICRSKKTNRWYKKYIPKTTK